MWTLDLVAAAHYQGVGQQVTVYNRMSAEKILIFAIVLCGVLFYIFEVEMRDRQSESGSSLLFEGVKEEHMRRIAISNRSGSFAIVNTGFDTPAFDITAAAPTGSQKNRNLFLRKWEIEGIDGAILDLRTIANVLTFLRQIPLTSPVPRKDGVDKSVYGLVDPELSLSVEHTAGSETIHFGKKSEFLDKRYLEIEGRSEFYLISEDLFDAANRTQETFREPFPFDFLDTEIARMSFASDSDPVSLEKSETGEWVMRKPSVLPADQDAVARITRLMRNLRVEKFHDSALKNLASFNLEKPEFRVTLEFLSHLERQPLEVHFSGLKGSEERGAFFYIVGKPTAYEIFISSIPRFNVSVESLRRKRLFQFSVDRVTEVVFDSSEDVPLNIVRRNGVWEVEGEKGDDVFIQQLLGRLSGLKAVEFPIQNREFGFGNPTLTVTVRLEPSFQGDPEEQLVLVIGDTVQSKRANQTGYYAVNSGISEVFIIDESSLRKILPSNEVLLAGTEEFKTEEGESLENPS